VQAMVVGSTSYLCRHKERHAVGPSLQEQHKERSLLLISYAAAVKGKVCCKHSAVAVC
jgi:hypothetical protein